ncbi:GNAT family N-acetyltransferase [Asanoa ferruginea]|nr:GNAT family N-acetyltransferase [Asanoa ferruginea]
MGPAVDDPDHDARLAEAAGDYFDRFLLKLKVTAERHPTEPHHHLAFLGVQPSRQGTGLGTALLDAYHRVLDASGTPAFLEATNERNSRLYVRHGYRAAEPVYLPHGGPPMWPMWRDHAGACNEGAAG